MVDQCNLDLQSQHCITNDDNHQLFCNDLKPTPSQKLSLLTGSYLTEIKEYQSDE